VILSQLLTDYRRVHHLGHWWEPGGKEWARFAEARNVRAGGADPHHG
jgi:hypothetical protein